jgi:signal transduction histidine kinase
MGLMGLSMLQIQDGSGRILSSGHFRNEYDLRTPELVEWLASLGEQPGVVEARTAEGPFLALVRVDSIRLGGQRFSLIGGVRLDRSYLAQLINSELVGVSLIYPGGVLSSDANTESALIAVRSRSVDMQTAEWEELRDSLSIAAVVRDLMLPFLPSSSAHSTEASEIDDASPVHSADARIVVTHSLTELRDLRRGVDRWFLTVVIVTATAAFIVVLWLSSRLSRPLVALAEKTEMLDLDRLDVDFSTKRRDEVGELSRLLGAMTGRLRSSAATLREVERRAAMGDLARQVNHDIKNGLTPIRNIVRHLDQVGREQPERLGAVFRERHRTLESSIAYLETLASKYARLSPGADRQQCDANAVVHEVVGDLGKGGHMRVEVHLEPSLPPLAADPVALRRILENVVGNAVDSLNAGSGHVAVTTMTTDDARPSIRIVIRDTGKGMTREELDRAFDDFYTTKSGGTGLGLSIVRRLVMDLHGSLRVESEPGVGTTVVLDFPVSTETPVSSHELANGIEDAPRGSGDRPKARGRGA